MDSENSFNSKQKRLVLHFDINKTLVLADTRLRLSKEEAVKNNRSFLYLRALESNRCALEGGRSLFKLDETFQGEGRFLNIDLFVFGTVESIVEQICLGKGGRKRLIMETM